MPGRPGTSQPGSSTPVEDLATALSVAVRIDPELIRSIRLGVFPYHDVAAEADLWFSDLVRSRGAQGIVLEQDVRDRLQRKLSELLSAAPESDPIHCVGEIMARTHAHLSPALLVEEQVTWHAIRGAMSAVDDALRPALKAALVERRQGVIQWFSAAWNRLPDAARQSVTAWKLAQVSGQRPARGTEASLRIAPPRLRTEDLADIVSVLPDTRLLVRRAGANMQVGDLGTAEDVMAVRVPDTNPRLLKVAGIPGSEPRSISVRQGDTTELRVGLGAIRLQTARGVVYELPPPFVEPVAGALHLFAVAEAAYSDKSLVPLPGSIAKVKNLSLLLSDHASVELLQDQAESKVRDRLRRLRDSLQGSLVVLWTGHGTRDPSGTLRLLTRDSDARYRATGITIGELVDSCAGAGASQILFIIDACLSGASGMQAGTAAEIVSRYSTDNEMAWVGALVSCTDVETFNDGLLLAAISKLLARGPDDPMLKIRWSPYSRYIRGDDFCDAVLVEWQNRDPMPDFAARGSAWPMFPNPLYQPGAPMQVVESLLLAARGGAAADEQSWFTGRAQEVNRVIGWIRARQPGIYVITGSPGTGKSAIAGRVVSLSDPQERARLLRDGRPWAHEDPGEWSVQAHLEARGLTADRAAAALTDQLVACNFLAPQEEPRSASMLVGRVQQAVENGAPPPVLVIDGLDEARAEAFMIAEDLLARLAPYAVIVVATREIQPGSGQRSLLAMLATPGRVLDLDAPEIKAHAAADIRDYLIARLAGVDPRMEPVAVADYLASAQPDVLGTFLLARVITDNLRATPVDTTMLGWQARIGTSLEEALAADLAAVSSPQGALPPETLARVLLTALTWAYGHGFPEEEWLATANALAPRASVDRDDLSWLLGQLGRYVIQDGEAGTAVYRLSHHGLGDYLRPPFQGRPDRPFDPQALPVARALAARYRALLEAGIHAADPVYLWRYQWRHAADAGLDGLADLRELAQEDAALRPDVALAGLEIANRLQHGGHLTDAISLTEETVGLYRELSASLPELLPELARALAGLAARYAEAGRAQDSLAPAEESVRLYRELSASLPELLPELARALAGLAARYAEAGRAQDSLAPAEESVRLYRELSASLPELLPELARALAGLAARYAEAGRAQDSLAPAEESATIYRELSASQPEFLPDLADVLDYLRLRLAGTDDLARVESMWQAAVQEASPTTAASVLVARAREAKESDPDAVGWLVRALQLAEEAPALEAEARAEARRRRAVDTQSFDAAWRRGTGQTTLPRWLWVAGESMAYFEPPSPLHLVVVLPGFMGSTLRRGGRLVWSASIRAARSFSSLQLPEDIGDNHPEDGVEPADLVRDVQLIPGMWSLSGYTRLLDRLRSLGYRDARAGSGDPPGNLLPVAYDWRLSHRWTGRWLGTIVEPALERWRTQSAGQADAKVVFVCHSIGGLAARWYIERCGGAELTAQLITIGTPYRGAVRALEQIINGVKIGAGPLSVDLTAFIRSLPSMYQMLPEYACIQQGGDLAKIDEISIPGLDARKVADAMEFQRDLLAAERQRAESLSTTIFLVGTGQPTPTTARLDGFQIVTQNLIRGADLSGDSVVPAFSAAHPDAPAGSVWRISERHADLIRNQSVLDQLEGILTARPVEIR